MSDLSVSLIAFFFKYVSVLRFRCYLMCMYGFVIYRLYVLPSMGISLLYLPGLGGVSISPGPTRCDILQLAFQK